MTESEIITTKSIALQYAAQQAPRDLLGSAKEIYKWLTEKEKAPVEEVPPVV